MLKQYISDISRSFALTELSDQIRGEAGCLVKEDKGDLYLALLENREEETHVDQGDKELVFTVGGARLFHYKNHGAKKGGTPLLIIYSLINRQYMMDLQPDRSVIRKFVDGGQDVYSIDWGYPAAKDMYLSMEDYINRYMDACVDYMISATGYEKINLLGVCQGGVFSLIYTALHQSKIKNLITMVVPINFDTEDALLFRWCKLVNVENLNRAFGLVSGDCLNYMFLFLKPYELNVEKYRSLALGGYRKNLPMFLRMEHWTFDCPNESGAMLLDCMDGLFIRNLLYKGEFRLGNTPVDTHDVTCPVLCVCGEKDHIVPISASAPLMDIIGSRDKTFMTFKTGHIGMYVSTSSQNSVSPQILDWIAKHE